MTMVRVVRRMVAGCGVAVCAATASAQVGFYGEFAAKHYDDGTANGASNGVNGWFPGGTFGIYDDFIHLGPVHAGLDVRGNFGAHDDFQYRNFLGGVRVGLKAPVLPLRPYVQGSIGGGGTRYTGALAAGIGSASYSTKFTYEVLGGLDFTVIPHFDFRVVEIGVGRQSGVGSGGSVPSVTTVQVSTGLVFRL